MEMRGSRQLDLRRNASHKALDKKVADVDGKKLN